MTVAQDSGAHSELVWASLISAGPANESTQTLLFSAITDNDALFLMRPEISLSFTPAANARGVANVSITLSDNGGMANGGIDTTATQTMVITVTGTDAGAGDDAGTPSDAGTVDDAGVIDDGGVVADAGSAGGGAGGGTGGGSAGTGGGGEVDAGVDPGGSTPGCGCSGTDGTGLFMLALAGLLVLSRRQRVS